jgi:hypothetical protein
VSFLIGKGWIQAVLLVVLCGFFVLGLLAYRTYMAHPGGCRHPTHPLRFRRGNASPLPPCANPHSSTFVSAV